MSKLSFALGFSCFALLAFSARAEDLPAVPPAAPEPQIEELIEAITIESVSAILVEAGAEDVKPSSQEKVVLFKSGSRNYFVALNVCEEATHLCSVVSIGRAIKAKLPLEVLNKINEKYNGLVAATRISDSSFKMVHATVVGGGVTKNNIAVNLVWYVNETPEFETFIKSQLIAEATRARPDVQNVSAGLPLGDVVLAPGEISALVEKLHLPTKQTLMKVK